MTKALDKLRADKRIEEILVEGGMAQHRVSYFVHLSKGFSMGGTGEAHCFGEDTLRDIQRTLRYMVTPCECDECTGDKND